ncbi:MAG TPA: acyl-CoA dehydrogenase family protein [Candidatus Binatia bacterium]|nr:acyl-CoA dehydrogenase family protein [Candidatus Binatia bacterium]
MDFGLSQDQVLLKDTIRRWLEAECPTTRVRAVMESASGHDPALWRGLADLGVTGLQVPPAHGGAGLELLDVALAAEELGWACTPGPFLGSAMATAALLASDDTEAHRRWLPGIASGEVVATLAIGEDSDEWDAAKLGTCAEGAALHGQKTLVPAATVADVIVVAAQDASGPGLWLVERGARGLEVGALQGTDMTRRVATVTLRGTPATKLTGGHAAIDRARDAGLVLLAADAYGGARRCIDMTARYTLTREQFGQPIGAFQAVKHQLADVVTDVEPALSLWWYAAHAWDHIPDRAERHAALAKAHLADLFDRVTRVCTELHGGIGFTWEYDLHLWFRRAVFDRAYLGNAEYHRARAADLAGW